MTYLPFSCCFTLVEMDGGDDAYSVIASEAKQSIKPRSKYWIASSQALLAMTVGALFYSSINVFMCSTASTNSSLNSCTTAVADFTLSIRPTPWPTK